MSDLETLKAQHPCIEGVLKVYADAGPDGCSQRERAMVDLLALVKQHEATIAELNTRLARARRINRDSVKQICAESDSDLAAARATIQDLKRELEEVDAGLIEARKMFGIPSAAFEAYKAAIARHFSRAQQESEAKKEE